VSSATDICNVALLRVGNTKFITDLADTTDDSTEAVLCRLLYPKARNAVLESIPWQFATARSFLSTLELDHTGWDLTYALPSDCIFARYLATGLEEPAEKDRIPFVLESADGLYLLAFTDAVVVNEPAVDATVEGATSHAIGTVVQFSDDSSGATEGSVLLSDVTGTFTDAEFLNAEWANVDLANSQAVKAVLLTDQADAELVYTQLVTDTSRFSELFADAVSWRVASDLALGLAVKPAVGLEMVKGYKAALLTAGAKDFSQSQKHPNNPATYIRARRG
jgi:hypothetical protein